MTVKIHDIFKEYENFILNVSELELSSGKIIGLVGKNGSGKTTLLKILFALVHSPKVSVEIEGNKLYVDNQNWKSRLFFSPETNIIPDLFKMADVEKFYSRFYKNWNSEEFKQYLKEFEVPNKPLKDLSLGNKKKLSLAASFASNAEIVILDEPLSNIDPVERQVLKNCMSNYKGKDRCIIYSSHILPEVIELCDNIVALKNGNCVLNTKNENLNEDSILELIK